METNSSSNLSKSLFVCFLRLHFLLPGVGNDTFCNELGFMESFLDLTVLLFLLTLYRCRIVCPKFGHPVKTSNIYLSSLNLNLRTEKNILQQL